MKNEYRVHITIRRRGESIFDSEEFKTELCEDLDDVMAQSAEFIVATITDDMEQDDETN